MRLGLNTEGKRDHLRDTPQGLVRHLIIFLSEPQNQLSFHRRFVNIEVPKTVEEALSIPEWCQAIKDEFQSIKKNNVWELTKLPKNLYLVRGR